MDDPNGEPSPAPVLEYGQPPAPNWRSFNHVAVRFTAGVAIPLLGVLVANALAGEDMICCDAIGLMLEIFLIGGSFQLGQRWCRWVRGRPLVERNRALTVIVGIVVAVAIFGTFAAIEGLPRPLGGILCVLAHLAAPSASPWCVLRIEY